MSTRWRVEVDRELCIGAGLCVIYAPETFEHDAAAKAIVRAGDGDPLAVVQGAVVACPTGALRLVDLES